MLLSIFSSLGFWLILSHLGVLVVGVFMGWNNPRNKVKAQIEAEITKAAHEGNADVLNVLTIIKSKL